MSLRNLNEMLRKVRTVQILCTVTTASGETKSIKARVAVNKIGMLNGNSLSTKALYDLVKTGKAQTNDIYGNNFLYEILENTSKNVLASELQAMEAKGE